MPADTPPRKNKRRRSRAPEGPGLRYFALVLTLLVLLTIFGIAWAFLPVSKTRQPTVVQIPNAATARQIAQKLKEKGVIRSDIAFLVMAKLLGETNHMKAGDYEVSPNMTLAQIITLLVRGEGLATWVTIPEGYTLRQIADLISDKELGDARHFERIARVGGGSFTELSFKPPRNLEGYLYPDTYKFRRKTTERQILAEMLGNFDDKVAKPLKEEFNRAASRGRSMEEVIILASMVEREALRKKEQPVIAGVILNRLKEGMKLQIDATVQYALAAPKRRLLLKDLDVASPYNTYRIEGLPPGPISNPGLDAIKAALRPADTSALYYVAKPDGSHIFTRTFEEHKAAKRKVQRMARSE